MRDDILTRSEVHELRAQVYETRAFVNRAMRSLTIAHIGLTFGLLAVLILEVVGG
jgi:hypothetical protein